MATVKDVVLIYLENQPVTFARIENIEPDAKKDWYHVKLLMLQIPVQSVTWILKAPYISGEEFFMNGKQMRLEKIESPSEENTPEQKIPANQPSTDTGEKNVPQPDDNVIRFSDLKKK